MGHPKIYSTGNAFAALKTDGSITAWGDSDSGGAGAPSGTGYTKIYSTGNAFAALKTNGLRLGLKNRQVGEKWVADDCSYLCKGLD
jgi:hypothetical protein